MEIFSVLLALCAGNSSVTGEFPSQRPVMRSFDVSLLCALNKRLSKQSRGWWFETPRAHYDIIAIMWLYNMQWLYQISLSKRKSNNIPILCDILRVHFHWNLATYYNTWYPYLNTTNKIGCLCDRRPTWIHVTFSCSSVTMNNVMAPKMFLYSHVADMCY